MNTEREPESTDRTPAREPAPPAGGTADPRGAQGPPPGDQPPAQAGWGAPPPPPERRPRWSTRRTIAAGAIALGIAAAGGAAIFAASGATDDGAGNPKGGPGGGGPGGGMMIAGPKADIAHGEFQNGEVTAISDDSITAKSDDGYERTYVITDDTAMSSDIAEGDEVMIFASTDGDTATAETIAEDGGSVKGQDRGPVLQDSNGN